MIAGVLVVEGKNLKVRFTNQNGKEMSATIPEDHMASALVLKKKIGWAGLDGMAVDLDVENGQPRRVRPQGESWLPTSPDTVQVDRARNDRGINSNPQRVVNANRQPAAVAGDFHNPYNFVPALPRDRVPKDSELNDHTPVGHSQYLSKHWSGSIRVELNTKTPLLIPDAFKVEEAGEHKTYPIRMVDGKPHLPVTSFKGMLRSAYEAVTNSRLSIFGDEHSDRLFYRMSASEGLSLVPAIVEGGKIRLMQGTTDGYPSWNNGNRRWTIPDDLMYAAWLPSYHQQARHNLRHNLHHGDRVRVWLEQYEKTRNGNPIFKHWRVIKMVAYNQQLGEKPSPGSSHVNYSPVKGVDRISVDGYLCITGKNIKGKHDERVFFNHVDNEGFGYDLSQLNEDWQYLIKDYQQLHEGENRNEGLDWSRHVIGGDQEQRLDSHDRPTLCYAFVDTTDDQPEIIALYPVMISRAIYDYSPSELLDYRLKPAIDIDLLSPADRVFGWVNQSGNGAYKGQLRITAVDTPEANGIESFDPPLALAILGQPKPQQSRFYAAQDLQGTPIANRTDKNKGYSHGQGLRGRKVYPHHQTSVEYWEVDENRQISVGDRYREYLSVNQQPSSQNKSIRAWVKPGEKFVFDIDVINLSGVELGALLWLLNLDDQHYFRLGSGKPLGFGSSRLTIVSSQLGQGEDFSKFYSSLTEAATFPEQSKIVQECIESFRQEIRSAYRSSFSSTSFIAAFLKSTQGFGKPVHYPRITKDPRPEGESFKWFVTNEHPRAPKYSLGNLIDDPGLPINPNS
jgi:CRISPR-associated protein (TIGR03986 family)